MHQIRGAGDDQRFYRPDRDVAYIYVGAIEEAFKRVLAGEDAAISAMFSQSRSPEVQANLADAVVTLCEACRIGKDDPASTFTTALESSGFRHHSPLVQTMLLAQMGLMYMELGFEGARQAAIGPGNPMLDLDERLDKIISSVTENP